MILLNLGTINSVTAVAELAATLGQGGHPLAMLGQLLTIEIRAQCPPICPAADAVLWLHANGTSAPLQLFPGVPLVNERANITLQVLREREISFLTDCRPVPFFVTIKHIAVSGQLPVGSHLVVRVTDNTTQAESPPLSVTAPQLLLGPLPPRVFSGELHFFSCMHVRGSARPVNLRKGEKMYSRRARQKRKRDLHALS